MRMGTCYIVGAGDFVPLGFAPGADDWLIAADGGVDALAAVGVKPELLVGDCDSLAVLPEDVPLLRYPVEKDDTDMGLALEEGFARGFRTFAIYGGGGGREDHLLANLQSMCRLSRMGACVRMVCRAYTAYAVTDGTLELPERTAGTLASVFCNGDRAEGVTLAGLHYPLNRATLTCDRPLGVSNHYVGGRASVTVERGTLLALVYHEEKYA